MLFGLYLFFPLLVCASLVGIGIWLICRHASRGKPVASGSGGMLILIALVEVFRFFQVLDKFSKNDPWGVTFVDVPKGTLTELFLVLCFIWPLGVALIWTTQLFVKGKENLNVKPLSFGAFVPIAMILVLIGCLAALLVADQREKKPLNDTRSRCHNGTATTNDVAWLVKHYHEQKKACNEREAAADYVAIDRLIQRRDTSADVLCRIVDFRFSTGDYCRPIASHPNTTTEMLDKLADCEDDGVLDGVVRNPKTRTETLRKIYLRGGIYFATRAAIARHPNAPIDMIKSFCESAIRSPIPEERQFAAMCPKAAAEVLIMLAKDENPKVRASVAENAATPAATLKLLAMDPEESVRLKAMRAVEKLK
ncbi:MAG: hypothetical protein WCV00_19440 [Verrucomicrobiia bacterium]